MTPQNQDDAILEEDEKKTSEPHIPEIAKKVSRFGPQNASKFGKSAMGANPPMKQRPGRAAGRGR